MFAQRFKELRIRKELSQAQVATMLSASPSTIGMYEQGKRMPDAETILHIARFFNVTTDYLLGAESSEEESATKKELFLADDFTDEEKDLIYDHYIKTIQLYRRLSKRFPEA
ncbi:MAG: helix-turn-helix domain-containing protein [Peptococcaceae bacterium]|nr:helix-turn-helix domain-containing protein [Peptococcaceae bacterium]